MGGSQSTSYKTITLQSVDDLPNHIFAMYLEKAKHDINDQYASNMTAIHFPCYGYSTIHMNSDGVSYRIKYDVAKKFDEELAKYCRERIQRPYVLIARTIYLVENYHCAA